MDKQKMILNWLMVSEIDTDTMTVGHARWYVFLLFHLYGCVITENDIFDTIANSVVVN